MARPPHPDRHPHRRGARDARGAAGRGRVVGCRRRAQHRGEDPVGRPDRRHPRQPDDVSRDAWTRSRSARPSPSRRRGRPSRSRSGRSSGRKTSAGRGTTPRDRARRPRGGARRAHSRSPTSCWKSVRRAWRRSSARPASARAAYCSSSCDDSRSSFTVHRGKCLSYGEGITYWPIVEIFKSAAGILQSDDRETSAQKLDTFLETLPTDDLDELRTIASALSNLIGIPTTPRGTYVTSEISQAELHWGIRRTLQLLAAERPTAVVVEDLHWAEPTLLELISYILADEAEACRSRSSPRRGPRSRTRRPASWAREGRRRTDRPADARTRAGSGAAERSHR